MKSATRFRMLVVLTTLLAVSLSTAENPKTTISTSKPINMSHITNLINVKHAEPSTQPPIVRVSGMVDQIYVQPGEQFYFFVVETSTGDEILRIADAQTGTSLKSVDASNLVYDLMKQAYLRKLKVQVGYRDFGYIPKTAIKNLVIKSVYPEEMG